MISQRQVTDVGEADLDRPVGFLAVIRALCHRARVKRVDAPRANPEPDQPLQWCAGGQ